MQPASTPSDADGGRNPWRRYGPIALVAVVVAALVGASFLGGDDPGDEPGGTTGGHHAHRRAARRRHTWGMAQEEAPRGHVPRHVRHQTGQVAIPFFFRAECVAENDTDGGASARGHLRHRHGGGVAAQRQRPDLRHRAPGARHRRHHRRGPRHLRGHDRGVPASTTRPTAARSSLEFVEASGSMLDPVSARADAVRAAEYEPFAVLGGPLLASTWTEELHARDIVCLFCPGINDSEPTAFGCSAHPGPGAGPRGRPTSRPSSRTARPSSRARAARARTGSSACCRWPRATPTSAGPRATSRRSPTRASRSSRRARSPSTPPGPRSWPPASSPG